MTDIRIGAVAEKPTALPATLTREQYKVLGLSSLGGALEFYEFVVFVYLTPYIGNVFFPPDSPPWLAQLQALAIFSIGYLIRPLGGIFLANLGDLLGRRKIFSLTLVLMAAPTAAIGLLPGYAQVGVLAPICLLVCRVLQGLALGGEIPGAMVFVSEHVAERSAGRSIGLLGAAFSIGSLCAAQATALVGQMDKASALAYGWRLPFILGGVFGLGAAYLRRYVHETPVFEQMKQHRALSKGMPIRLLLGNFPVEASLCIVACCVSAAVVPSVYLYPTTYLQVVQGFSPTVAHGAAAWATIAGIVGCLISGFLIDHLGPTRAVWTMTLPAVPLIYWLYFTVEPDPESVALRFALVGFLFTFHIMLWIPVIFSLPPQTRYTGVAFGYNVAAAGIGGLTPVLLAAASHYDKLAVAHFPAFFCGLAMLVTPILWRYRKA